MTRVLLFTPTYRPGGVDVASASVERQTLQPDAWLIADDLFEQRSSTWEIVADALDLTVYVFGPTDFHYYEPRHRNLCSAYNAAAQYATDWNYDLFISMQDYIYVPEDGIERFVKLHENNPDKLLTGLTDISSDPFPVRMKNPKENAAYSIFQQPYIEKPKIISWEDSRDHEVYAWPEETVVAGIMPQHWEANWAAVPVDVFRAGVFWDEDYDYGVAYENMDFAHRAQEAGFETILDRGNRTISLPHKKYWPSEEKEIEDFSNRSRYESRWM